MGAVSGERGRCPHQPIQQGPLFASSLSAAECCVTRTRCKRGHWHQDGMSLCLMGSKTTRGGIHLAERAEVDDC